MQQYGWVHKYNVDGKMPATKSTFSLFHTFFKKLVPSISMSQAEDISYYVSYRNYNSSRELEAHFLPLIYHLSSTENFCKNK